MDVLRVQSAIRVTEAGKLAILRDIKTETIARDVRPVFDCLTSPEVEAFSADLVVAVAGNDHVLLRNEAYRVDDWVLGIAVVFFAPFELDQGCVKSSLVPDLDTFATCATARHDIIVTVAYVDGITANGGLTPDGHAQTVGSNVPKANLAVPATRNKHVGGLRVEAAGEDFAGVGFVHTVANLLHPLHALLVVDLDVRLRPCHTEATHIASIVNRMIFLIAVQNDVLDLVAIIERPSNDRAIEAGSEELLRLVEIGARRPPRQTRDRHSHLLVLDLVHMAAHHRVDNLQRAVKEADRCQG